MLGARESLLQDLKYPGQVKTEQGRDIEPEPGEHLAAYHTCGIGGQADELTFLEDEPVNGLIEDAPDDVLAHLALAVNAQSGVQIVTDGTRGHLSNQFRRSFDVIVRADHNT